MRIRRYLRQLYDQPKVGVPLKTRMVKAKAIEALLCECSTWTLRQEHYLQAPHRRPPGRSCFASSEHSAKHQTIGMTSYYRALEKTKCESIDTTVRARSLFFCGRGDAHPDKRRAVAKGKPVGKPCLALRVLRVQCDEDGVARKKSGSVAHRTTPERLA